MELQLESETETEQRQLATPPMEPLKWALNGGGDGDGSCTWSWFNVAGLDSRLFVLA